MQISLKTFQHSSARSKYRLRYNVNPINCFSPPIFNTLCHTPSSLPDISIPISCPTFPRIHLYFSSISQSPLPLPPPFQELLDSSTSTDAHFLGSAAILKLLQNEILDAKTFNENFRQTILNGLDNRDQGELRGRSIKG